MKKIVNMEPSKGTAKYNTFQIEGLKRTLFRFDIVNDAVVLYQDLLVFEEDGSGKTYPMQQDTSLYDEILCSLKAYLSDKDLDDFKVNGI